MESRAPAVVAVVVTTGPGPGLEATLASLLAQDYEEIRVLVGANGETEHVAARLSALAPKAFFRALDENKGFGAACNEAALMIEGSAFFLFCHDDVRLESDAIQQMVEAAFRTNAGIVSPKVVTYDDPMVLLHVGQTSDRFGVVEDRVELGEIDHGQQDLERDVFVAPGGVTLVRTDLFTTLRGFDPMITLLGEDLDLCWRAQVAGARIVVAPLAKVAHREPIAKGERLVTAVGTRRASRQDLQRRHQLLVVATGWGRRQVVWTLMMLFVIDTFEVALALASRDLDRAGAIAGSWRWLIKQRRGVRQRRRQLHRLRVLSDAELHRLQVGGANRLKHFFVTLLREGYDKARGILPPDETLEAFEETEGAGVGFAAAFSEDEEFDEIAERGVLELRTRPSRLVMGNVATLLCVVVLERGGHGHAGHARLRGAGLRGHVRVRAHGRLAPIGADLRGARGRLWRGSSPQGSRVESRANLWRLRLRGDAPWSQHDQPGSRRRAGGGGGSALYRATNLCLNGRAGFSTRSLL